MKITFKHTLVAAALMGAFGVAQAQTTTSLDSGDLPYDLGANPTSENAYVVTHDTGSFSDVYTFTLSQESDTVSSAVALQQPSLSGGGFDYNIEGGTFGLYSDADGDGIGGTLISSTTFGSNNTSLTADSVAAGSYYWMVAGNANGDLGGIYNFTTNTAAVPVPETYALMLAGLGLLGFVGKRRMRQSSVNKFA